jgi:hypothetical protein
MSRNTLTDKDAYKVQRARLERIVTELSPRFEIEFDADATPNWIEFRIADNQTGAVLAVSPGDWHVSEIADKSDSWLRKFIVSLSGGKI